jgi:hypothetical protein
MIKNGDILKRIKETENSISFPATILFTGEAIRGRNTLLKNDFDEVVITWLPDPEFGHSCAG